jgi:hypothetical protein
MPRSFATKNYANWFSQRAAHIARADKSLRTALTFIDENIPKDIQAKKANSIKRAHNTLEDPPRYNRKRQNKLVVALLWSMDFITKYHYGKGVPGLVGASVLLSEIKLITGEKLAGGTVWLLQYAGHHDLVPIVEAFGCHWCAQPIRQFSRNLTSIRPWLVSEGEMRAGDDGIYPLVTVATGTNHHKMEAIMTEPLGPAAVAIVEVISVADLVSRVECARTDRCRHAKPATEGYRANQPTQRPRRGTVAAADAGYGFAIFGGFANSRAVERSR